MIPLIFRPLFCNFYIKFLYFFNILNSHWQLHKFRIKSLRYSRGRVGAPYFLSNGNWRAEKSGKSQRLKDSKQLMTAALDILPDDIGQGFSMIASVLCLLKKKKKMIRISKLYLLSTIDLYAQDWPPWLPPIYQLYRVSDKIVDSFQYNSLHCQSNEKITNSHRSSKGQLISKCLFGVFNSRKKRMKTIRLEIP